MCRDDIDIADYVFTSDSRLGFRHGLLLVASNDADHLTSRADHLTSRADHLTSRADHLTSRAYHLTSRADHLT